MTYGNFAALAQRNLKRMLAYSSIAHAGYILVGVAAASVSIAGSRAAGAVLYYLVVYAFANVGAFAVAAWLVRDKKTDDIDDLNGLGFQQPLLALCILLLMLSLIGIPPLAGFFAKLYVFMEALDQANSAHPVTLMWLVALGLFNSVVSAFYYVRVLKAMFLREAGARPLEIAEPADRGADHRRYAGRRDRRDHGRVADHADAGRGRIDADQPDPGQVLQAPKLPPGVKPPPKPVYNVDPAKYGARIKGTTGPGGGPGPAPAATKKAQPPAPTKASPSPPPADAKAKDATPAPAHHPLRPSPKARQLQKERQTGL